MLTNLKSNRPHNINSYVTQNNSFFFYLFNVNRILTKPLGSLCRNSSLICFGLNARICCFRLLLGTGAYCLAQYSLLEESAMGFVNSGVCGLVGTVCFLMIPPPPQKKKFQMPYSLQQLFFWFRVLFRFQYNTFIINCCLIDLELKHRQ